MSLLFGSLRGISMRQGTRGRLRLCLTAPFSCWLSLGTLELFKPRGPKKPFMNMKATLDFRPQANVIHCQVKLNHGRHTLSCEVVRC